MYLSAYCPTRASIPPGQKQENKKASLFVCFFCFTVATWVLLTSDLSFYTRACVAYENRSFVDSTFLSVHRPV